MSQDDGEFNSLLLSCLNSLKESVELAATQYKTDEQKQKFGKEAESVLESYIRTKCERKGLLTAAKTVENNITKKVSGLGNDDDENYESDAENHSDDEDENGDTDIQLRGIEEIRTKEIEETYHSEEMSGTQNDDTNIEDLESLETDNGIDIDAGKMLEQTKKPASSKFTNDDLYKKYRAEIGEILTSDLAVCVRSEENITDPISKMVMECPVKNKKCGHNYDKKTIVQYFGNKPTVACPYVGCKCNSFSLDDLEENTNLLLKIQNRLRTSDVTNSNTNDYETIDADAGNDNNTDDEIKIDEEDESNNSSED